jgi:hypothetical protein
MHNRLLRNSVILLIVCLYVITARHRLINGLFSVWVGVWAMSKLFHPLFGPHQGFEELTIYDFIPRPGRIVNLFFESTRRRTLFILLWWAAGVVVGLATYKVLNVLLVSP